STQAEGRVVDIRCAAPPDEGEAMKGLKDKVALVTGAASGIGRATAIRLAEEGALVVAADRNLPGAEETRAQLAREGVALCFDAADPSQCAALVESALGWRGRIDILANIAGIGGYGH